ncbi:hypothetical protein Tco_0050533, partial [Tanacetum coccineum]
FEGVTFVSESNNEEAEEHDVDPLIKLAKAAASAADTSPIPSNDIQTADIPPGASTHTTAFGSDADVPTGPSFGLGAEAAKKLYEEEQAELAREQEERQRKRQEDVLNSAKYYTDDDWIQRMVKVIAERRRQFKTQRFIEKRNKPMTYARIRILRRSIKRPGADLDQPTSKKSKSNEAPHTSVPPHSPEVTPVSPPKPFDAAPSAAAPSNASSHPDVPHETSVDPTITSTPPCAPPVFRSSGPRTRSRSIDADIKTYST